MNTQIYKDIKMYLQRIIEGTKFENNLYAVGGCCRDELMNLPIKDIDLCVSLENGGIEFANWLESLGYTKGKVITYPRFGTAMFRLNAFPDEDLEVVQTRNEVYIDNTRKPQTGYGTIQEDCLRRDLTINNIYCNISTGKMVDVCGKSFKDIKKHIINTPCDPDQTYMDDPLRMFRCVRFAVRYNWKIEDRVLESIKKNIDMIKQKNISKERILTETEKILSSENIDYALDLLVDTGLIKYIFPTMESLTRIDASIYANEMIKYSITDFKLRVAHLMHYSFNFETDIENLGMPNATVDYIKTVLNFANNYSYTVNGGYLELMKLEYECKDYKLFREISKLIECFNELPVGAMMMKFNTAKQNMFGYKLPITGTDIIKEFNLKPGKNIKELLDECLNKAMYDNTINKTQCLMHIAWFINKEKEN